MRKNLLLCALAVIVSASALSAQSFAASEPRSWDEYPPEVQQRGFGRHAVEFAQMDDDPALEKVFLFSSDNGHYPAFDIFRLYYAIVDNYSGEVQYISDVVRSTERRLTVEDRNGDGRCELYRRYFAGGEFSVDEKGNGLRTRWAYDTIEWRPETTKP